MSELIVYEMPELHDPVMVIALGGTADVSGVSVGACGFLQDIFNAKEIAAIDPESFYNFARYRPLTMFGSDGKLQLKWPEITFSVAKKDMQRDLVFIAGVEPNYRWNEAAEAITSTVQTLGCSTVVILSSFAGAIPHSRPFPVTELSAQNEFAERYGMGLLPIDKPSGFLSLITEKLTLSVPKILSFEVEVPHYLPEPPNPKAMQLLLQAVEKSVGLDLRAGLFDTDVRTWKQNVEEAIEQDIESISYVKELEDQFDDDTVTANAQHDFVLDVENYLRSYTDDNDETGGT